MFVIVDFFYRKFCYRYFFLWKKVAIENISIEKLAFTIQSNSDINFFYKNGLDSNFFPQKKNNDNKFIKISHGFFGENNCYRYFRSRK